MNRDLTLHLQSAGRYERIEDVASFIGEDASGSFGLLPGHAPFLTLLTYGLARFRGATEPWRYLACPGAVLWFADDQLVISTRRYLVDEDYGRISGLLKGQLAEEEAALKSVKDNLQRLEQELFRRLRGIESQWL